MNAATQKAALAAAVYRCRDCGRPADFVCDDGKVNPPRRERRGSVEIEVQDFATFHLCEDCLYLLIRSDHPPRTVTALPHVSDAMRKELADRRRKSCTSDLAAHRQQNDALSLPICAVT